ncbi:MAG: polysaccharide biosynthesis tyrosine autokinase [Chitinophagaceae bacterium]
MEEQIKSNKSELWNLSVRDLFYKYLRFLPLFILSIAFSLLAAWVYLRYTTRIYGASGTMSIKTDKPAINNDKVEDIISGGNKTQNIQSEIEILKSRPLMERVVNKLHLQFSYTAIGKIKEFNSYKQSPFLLEALNIVDSSRTFSFNIKFIDGNRFRLNNANTFELGQAFENENGVFRLVKKGPAAPGAEYNVKWQPTVLVAGALANSVAVQPKTPGTGILIVSMQTTNASMSADVINNLMVQYDSMTVEQNNFSRDQIIQFVDEQLKILTGELDSIQLILLAYQQKNNIFDVQSQSNFYLDKMTEADKAINEQQLKLAFAETVENYLKDKSNKYNQAVVPSSLGLEDITLNELVSDYNKAQLKRQALLDAKVPLANPAVKQAEGQIEKLRESVLENLKNIKSSYVDVIGTLNKRSSTEQAQLKVLPYKLKEFVEIQRQVATRLALKSLLENKQVEAAIQRAATTSNSKVINLATSSDIPVKPNKRTIQIIAFLIGLGLPALFIFISEVINDKITTRYDIEKITAAPVLGEVGHSYSDNTLVVNKVSRSMVAEQFRIIRSNLQYVLPGIEKPVIIVTSSVSGEGKSFISTNMGGVMALTGKKTIILEFDIRKPKILSGLNIPKRSGISNFLVGKAEDLRELIIPVPGQENLFILPCGPVPPNPSELLLDSKVTDLFTWLRSQFDVIFIDTAPVGMVSDAMTLGKFADCTLYLVRQGHTFKKQIGLIDELYREKKLPKISIIINDVKIKPGYGYYGYGRYGYGYGYGYGQKDGYYEEETPRPGLLERISKKLNPLNWFGKKR